MLVNGGEGKVEIREDPKKGMVLKDAKSVFVDEKTYLEGFTIDDLISQGIKNRSISGTQANASSSRSHTIVCFTITSKLPTSSRLLSLKLNLIDLAGSERVSETGAQGLRLKEASQINLSLSVLTDVVSTLAKLKKSDRSQQQQQQPYLRFRDSKLTYFLKDSLGGTSYLMLIGCLSLEDKYIEDSMRTIEFAKNIKSIKF